MSDSTHEQLRQEILTLLEELNPSRKRQQAFSMDSSLERDLRLDSLGRAELLSRVEQRFQVALPERLLVEAETPGDLLKALAIAQPRSRPTPLTSTTFVHPEAHAVEEIPDRAQNLLEVLAFHTHLHPERIWIHLYGEDDTPEPITYGDLQREASEVAAGLLARDLEPGDAVALMLPTGREYFQAFWGILHAGGVPVPLYPPVRPSQLEDHLRRQQAILVNARAKIMVTVPQARPLARILGNLCPELRAVVTTPELLETGASPSAARIDPEDIAFLQYTSGSTGQPKGVVLTHANLVANVSTMGKAIEATSNDVFVSWLPLYHDMGLIGACMGSLFFGFPLVLMSPLAFLTRPARWLQILHRHRGTLSAAPNFAYELCLKKIDDSDLEGLDLSPWRLALNGAEPVNAGTLRRFADRFSNWGFRPEALFPAYGLAECSVGLAFPETGKLFRTDRIDRESLLAKNRAAVSDATDDSSMEIVGCGRAIPGHSLRIVNDASQVVEERCVGRVQFRGPSATSGYFENPEATAELFDGPWVETRDLGYFADGDLFLTGRAKDLIIRAGRNLLPYELEEAVGSLEDIRKGCVAVFGARDPSSGTEKLVVLAETRSDDRQVLDALREKIADLALEVLNTASDDIVLAPPGSVLKTSSGKIRRAGCRERYERGELGQGPKRVWMQVARLAFSGIAPAARQIMRKTGEHLWAVWAWMLFIVALLVLWPSMLLIPGRRRRQDMARRVARLAVGLAGIPVVVHGKLPVGPSVLVANHASYVDVPILTAFLPSGLTWVAKAELKASLFTRIPLARMGVRFVDRFDAARGLEDSRALAELAHEGERLAFFPEGTFDRRTGLLPFRLGAFRIAAEAGLPVVPVVLQGTRSVLRSETWLPKRRKVTLSIGEPIEPQGSSLAAAATLRDAAREKILEVSDEPDLSSDR